MTFAKLHEVVIYRGQIFSSSNARLERKPHGLPYYSVFTLAVIRIKLRSVVLYK